MKQAAAKTENIDWQKYIDELERTLVAMHERIDLFESVIDNFPNGIIVTDRNLRVVLCNRRQRELLDYPDALFAKGMPTIEELFRFNAERGEYGPGDVEAHVGHKMAQVRKNVAHVFERERPNGRVVEIRGMPVAGGGFVTSYADVTDNRRAAEIVSQLAMRDPLTGLGNRNLLRDRFQQLSSRARRGEGFALHYIDLDKFKPVNDRFGHEAGDKVLVEVARRLNAAIRDTDTAIRLGGDEFLVLQSVVAGFDDARRVAKRLLETLSEPYVAVGAIHEIGASIGVTLSTQDCNSLDDMLRKADRALYVCKSEGRGRFHIQQCSLGDACPLHKGSCEC